MKSFWTLCLALALAITLGIAVGEPTGEAQAQESLPAAQNQLGAQPGTNGAPPAGQQPSYEQQLSYSLGLNIGTDMRQNEIPIDLQFLVAGLKDALTGSQPKLSDQQRQAVMMRFQQEMQQKAQARMAEAGAKNTETGKAYLAENSNKDGVQTTKSGLQYRIIKQGTGASPTLTDTVRCHYEGTLIDGTVFDSSYKRGEPAAFPVNGVIPGWTEALQLMKVGGKWELYIPSDLAYGAQGSPPRIGPNQVLLFTIELLDIAK